MVNGGGDWGVGADGGVGGGDAGGGGGVGGSVIVQITTYFTPLHCHALASATHTHTHRHTHTHTHTHSGLTVFQFVIEWRKIRTAFVM